MDTIKIMDLCRLCLVNNKEFFVPIFDQNRIISHKIATCLPIIVEENDSLPQNICAECAYKVDSLYEFWNSAILVEKQLHAWLDRFSNNNNVKFEEHSKNSYDCSVRLMKFDSSEKMGSELYPTRQEFPVIDNSEVNTLCDVKEEKEENKITEEADPLSLVPVNSTERDVAILAVEDDVDSEVIEVPKEEKREALKSVRRILPIKNNRKVGNNVKIKKKGKMKKVQQKKVKSPDRTGNETAREKCKITNRTAEGDCKTFPKTLNFPTMKCTLCSIDCRLDDIRVNAQNKLVCKNCVDTNFASQALIGMNKHKKSLSCNVCSKEFKSKKVILRHLYVHQEDKPHVCDICFKTFKRPESLKTHKKIHDKNCRQYFCDSCNFSTAHKKSLEVHCKRHTLDYTARCEICGKGYYTNNELSDHMNIHSGAKPYVCSVCGKAYPYRVNLLSHMKYSHNPTPKDLSANQCEVCGKMYSFKRSLILHKKSHTGENCFVCDICGKTLTSKEHLKFHRRIHTGEKPSKCSYCGKCFAKSSNLVLHERVHTGEKPYTCEVCGKCFSQRSTLTIHHRYHTGTRPYVCTLCNRGFVCRALLTNHQKNPCAPERRSVSQRTSLSQFVEVIQPF